jgi:hypothetical protein
MLAQQHAISALCSILDCSYVLLNVWYMLAGYTIVQVWIPLTEQLKFVVCKDVGHMEASHGA